MNNPRSFGIALMDLLLEHEWPNDVTHAVRSVRDALISGDNPAILNARNATYSVNSATNGAGGARLAVYYAAASTVGSGDVTTAYAKSAAAKAKYALPHEHERIDALLNLFS